MIGRFVFACPVCSKRFAYDQPGEPCCTGPSETRDEHDLTVMRLLRVDKVDIHPILAEKHAQGPLIVRP